MAKLPTLALALLTLTTILITTSAHPTEPSNPLPEVLPSHCRLESLSLSLTTRNEFNTCDTVQLTRDNILQGINYLIALGRTPCVVGQGSVVFVTKGDVAITGYSGLMGGETSAPCHDVGMAVRWIVSHCAMGEMAFGGTTTAWGKKEVIIRVRRA